MPITNPLYLVGTWGFAPAETEALSQKLGFSSYNEVKDTANFTEETYADCYKFATMMLGFLAKEFSEEAKEEAYKDNLWVTMGGVIGQSTYGPSYQENIARGIRSGAHKGIDPIFYLQKRLSHYSAAQPHGGSIGQQQMWEASPAGRICYLFTGLHRVRQELQQLRGLKEAEKVAQEEKRREEKRIADQLQQITKDLVTKYTPLVVGKYFWAPAQKTNGKVVIPASIVLSSKVKNDIRKEVQLRLATIGLWQVIGNMSTQNLEYSETIIKNVLLGLRKASRAEIEGLKQAKRDAEIEREARRRLKTNEYEAAVLAKMAELLKK